VNYRILAIGKPKLGYAAEGVREYDRRLQRHASLDLDYLKSTSGSQVLLKRSEGTFRIALDERGDVLTSEEFARYLTGLEEGGDLKTVTFLIGGADGHDSALRDGCDRVLSLSALTMQHELALVVLLEQLYRASTIKRGEPYHRS